MDPAQRRRAERRLVNVLRRLHRAEPLRADVRVDALVARLRAEAAAPRPASHRGAAPLELDDAELRDVIEGLVTRGELVRRGHRVRLPEHSTALDGEMQSRVDRLLSGLRQAGAAPPAVAGIASRLGIPPNVLAQLRQAGILVSLGEGIDYPADIFGSLMARIDRISAGGPPGVARVRDELRTTRRHAEALIAARQARGITRP